ncbi:MAG: DUF255 domain-containing protein [Bacteroidales bacterium]
MFKSCSPYLKLFSEKGVKWHHTLDNELLNIAQEEDKLIFLHIGYISNITIRESSIDLFSNDEVISILNNNFISILEDKDDKPESYLLALDLLFLNQDFSYGPMNMFIMPNKKPIIAFSDCNPDNFIEIAKSILLAKKEKREKLKELSEELSKRAANTGVITNVKKGESINIQLLQEYLKIWFKKMFESDFMYRLKPFTPNPSSLITVVEYLKLFPDTKIASRIEDLLDHLQYSAIFDVLEGGFFRQTTDYSCTKSLYEKTLEENSQFLLLYALAYSLFGKESYRETAQLTYKYLVNELSNEKGGFINSSTLIGKIENSVYYSYSVNELSLIFPDKYHEVAIALGIDLTEEKMVKQFPLRGADTYIYLSQDDLNLLRERRGEHRGHYKDTRSISSSNSVAVSSLCQASRLLGDSRLYLKAIEVFEFTVYNNIDKSNGRLYRYTCCSDSYLIGYLSDYAHFIEASLELYRIKGESEYLHVAKRYTDLVIEKFYKPENGMFSKSEKSYISDTLPFKRESNIDLIRPSANSVMAGNLITLYEFTYDRNYLEIARQQLFNIAPNILNSGPMLSSWAHKILKYISLDFN